MTEAVTRIIRDSYQETADKLSRELGEEPDPPAQWEAGIKGGGIVRKGTEVYATTGTAITLLGKVTGESSPSPVSVQVGEHWVRLDDLAVLRGSSVARLIEINRTQAELIEGLETQIIALQTEVIDQQVEIAQLRARIEELEGRDDGDTQGPNWDRNGELLIAGPFPEPGKDYTGEQIGDLWTLDGQAWNAGWPSYTRPQGQRPGWCDVEGLTTDMLRMTLAAEGKPTFSATKLFEQHLPYSRVEPYAGGVKGVAYETRFRKVTDEAFRTIKLGGPVGFNDPASDRWKRWPGGGAHPGDYNFSVRCVLNSDFGSPSFSLYFYLGQDVDPEALDIEGLGPRAVLSNGKRTLEVVAANSFVQYKSLYDFRIEAEVGDAGKADGRARLYAKREGGSWVDIMSIGRIPWFAKGPGLFTRSYPVVMYGGQDESFEPQNPERTGIIDIGVMRTYELLG